MSKQCKSTMPSVHAKPIQRKHAAGIDIGATSIYVAVPVDRDPQPVRSFQTFTEDLHRLADWLQRCRIKTVAMESTGVFWVPLFQILEQRHQWLAHGTWSHAVKRVQPNTIRRSAYGSPDDHLHPIEDAARTLLNPSSLPHCPGMSRAGC